MDDIAPEIHEDAADPAIARAERRLRLLEELTEIGMSLARGLRDEAAGIAAGEAPARDPADAFARISRAVRLTLALEAKTDRELADLKAGVVREREEKRAKAAERARPAAAAARDEREETVCDLILAVAESECEREEDCEALEMAALERLTEDAAYFGFAEWPLRETVERLCHDLELNPDWSHWTGEGWDETYQKARSRFDPFARPSRQPILMSVQAGAPIAPHLRRLE